jgi:hypothetical protein
MMTILSNEARPANPDRLILRGLKKSAHSYLLYLPTSYILAERERYRIDSFYKHITRILRAGRVGLQVLRVPWCHARELDACTRITFSDLQQLLLALDLNTT